MEKDYDGSISEDSDNSTFEDDYHISEEYISEDSDDSTFEDDYRIHKEIVHFKDKKEPVSKSDVLEKASRLIFAEDLVSYISLKFHGYIYTTKVNKGSENSALSYPFNEAVRSAAQLIRLKIIETKCSSFEIIEKLIKSCKPYFGNFVDAVLCHYSEKGLTAGMFLCFSVYFSELASKCYTPDFKEMLDYAIYAILDAFCMYNEGTDELNMFANNVVHSLKDFPLDPSSDASKCTLPEIVPSRENRKVQVLENNFSDLENDIMESLSNLDLKLADKPNKFEILHNLETEINSVERLAKYMEIEKNVLCFMAKESNEQVEEPNLTSMQEISLCVARSGVQYNIQEFMNTVASEASLFSELYLPRYNQQNQKQSKMEENLKLKEFSNIPKKESNDPDIAPEEMTWETCFLNKAESPVQQEIKRKLDSSSNTLNFKNAKFRKTVPIVEKDLFKFETPKIENKETGENLSQTKCESGNANSELAFDNTTAAPFYEVRQILGIYTAYMPEGEVNEKNLKILKGESLLFSEDLVRYISKRFYDISYTSSKLEAYRNFLRNELDETVKEVAHFIHKASEGIMRVLSDLMKTVKREHAAECYRRYVTAILKLYDENGLNSAEFLYYCLHFSELALKLYAPDFPEILDLAVCSILDAFCRLKDDWNEFNASIKYVLQHFKTRTRTHATGYVHKFEKDCIDTIFVSLKEITSFIAEMESTPRIQSVPLEKKRKYSKKVKK